MNTDKGLRVIFLTLLTLTLIVSSLPLSAQAVQGQNENAETPPMARIASNGSQLSATDTSSTESPDLAGLTDDRLKVDDQDAALDGATAADGLAAQGNSSTLSESFQAYGADISTEVNNLSWMLYKKDGTIPDRDHPQIADYAIGLTHYEEMYAQVNFDISMPAGGFAVGDSITMAFLDSGFAYSSTQPEPFYASDGGGGTIEIGTWKLTSSKTLVITLDSPLITGYTAINGCQITTGKNLRVNVAPLVDTISTFTIGGKTVDGINTGGVSHDYLALKMKRTLKVDDFSKGVNIGSNEAVIWTLWPDYAITNDLTSSKGESIRSIGSDIILEDTVSSAYAPQSVSLDQAFVTLPLIFSETDTRSAVISGNMAAMVDKKTMFTQVSQNAGESYEHFKARLGVLEYGFYRTLNGDFKVIINLGNPTATTYPLKYSDVWPDIAAGAMSENKGVTPGEAAIIATSLGDQNTIGGNVVSWRFGLKVTYTQALIPTVKENTASITLVENGLEKKYSDSASATIDPGASIAAPEANKVTIVKADVASGAPLSNVVFKLQMSPDNGISWADTGLPTLTTGANGTATSETLTPGLYRFVEIVAAPGYDLDSATYSSSTDKVNGTFEIKASDFEGVVVIATNKAFDYTVRYDTNGGIPANIPDKTQVKWSNSYLLPMDDPTRMGYDFLGWIVSDSGTIGLHNGETVDDQNAYSDLADDASTFIITLQAQWRKTPTPVVSADLEITKIIRGDTPQKTESFSFVLSDTDRVIETINVQGAGKAIFSPITYTKEGVYNYTIFELAGFDPHYTYDDKVYTITDTVINVNDALQYQRTITLRDAVQNNVIFENVYSLSQAGMPLTADRLLLLVAFGGALCGVCLVVIWRLKIQSRRK